ncbi:glycosyltransferase family 2 protein [Romeria aff. gracilis LEGE 07310]|uniref:4,4'-diaponeurosporenoate glycosyltransferase n=1 Tax=Vasconcelosia minhoensis LEGE 07310 TaxID=915328 RepID=A0A8J7AP14_9CYAN|nr:glycosyltransferase [Romeria gracilis]MBE9078645.1 glycosyltransferase family 2 protein [Romeria aff. gracilis LEGE 07310]
MPPTVTAILPCFNESRHGYLPKILGNLTQQQGNPQLIAVVSPSQDDTLEVVSRYPAVNVISATAQNRAQRLNIGIQASQGEVVLLHHPATLLPPDDALQQVAELMADPAVVWGGFRHRFDFDHWLLRFTSWYSNQQRPRHSQILYLDHCIFARRQALIDIGGVPDMDIFEDTALSLALRQKGRPQLTDSYVTTSARRFRDRGIYQQALLNQLLKAMYHANLDPKRLNRLYEHRSQINVDYSDDS